MGTKNKKRKKSKAILATAISRGKWEMNTFQEIKEERGNEKEVESILSDKKKMAERFSIKHSVSGTSIHTYIKGPHEKLFLTPSAFILVKTYTPAFHMPHRTD